MRHVVILTSDGGGGHMSATKALEQCLQGEYTVTAVRPFKDILGPLDIFKKITGNRYAGEDLYNLLISKKYCRLMALLFFYCGPLYIRFRKKKIHHYMRDYFLDLKPDLIISVIPVINDIVLSVAQEKCIPFMLMPTDLDIRLYIQAIDTPDYQQFRLCLPFENHEIAAPAKRQGILKKQIVVTGSLLQASFCNEYDISHIKKQHGIPEGKRVIMILMGSQGSDSIQKYSICLMQLSQSIHLLICIGKNEKSREYLEKIIWPAHITVSIIGFTDQIAEMMAVSYVLITKPGTLSVCEGIYMNIPLLLNDIMPALPWEQFNYSFVVQHHLGELIADYNQLLQCVSTLLEDQERYSGYKKSLIDFPKKAVCNTIKQVIRSLLTGE